MTSRIQEFTGLRCIAVTMVVLGHAQQTLQGGYTGWLSPLKLISNGSQGVLIFFVLSGFLITGLLQREYISMKRINLFQFYMRRALRIWPAFYAYIITVAILSQLEILNIHWFQTTLAALHIWNYSVLFDIGTINNTHPDGTWYIGHFWSLALEEQFYWFWPPLLIFMLRRKSNKILLIIILAIPLIRIVTYFSIPGLRGQLGMMLHTGVDPILIGCYFSLNSKKILQYMQQWKHSSKAVTFAIFFLFFIVPIITSSQYGGYWSSTFGKTIEAGIIGCILIIISNQKNFWLSQFLRIRLFVFIGTISFSLYLWQQYFSGINTPGALSFPLNMVQSIIVATLSYTLIEKPFLRIKDHFHHGSIDAKRCREV